MRRTLFFGGPVVILAVLAWLLLHSPRYQSTDNAYVQIGKAPVSAAIAARVTAVYVKENQRVVPGQPLFRLDARDYQVSMSEARAELSQAELDVASLRAAYRSAQSKLAEAEAASRFAAGEAVRERNLARVGAASGRTADRAAFDAAAARNRIAEARADLEQARAAIGGDPDGPVVRQPRVLAARAKLDRAALNASYAVVLAPAAGIVTRVEQLQPGAYVNPSQTVFWLLTGEPWVEANFKEDQLEHMKIGQPVTIKIDAYPGEALRGRVASFSPATGAVFSVLPAQNATGNWVKVTQRLPVQIAFDHPPPAMAARAGLSAHVKVDVKAPGRS